MLKSYTEQNKPNIQSKKLTKHNKCTQVINQRFKVLPSITGCFNFVVNKFRENKAIFVHVFPKKINK